MENGRIIRRGEVPIMVCKESDNKYYPKTSNGVTYVLPSELKEMLPDLISFCENYTDDFILKVNANAINAELNHMKEVN